MSKITSDNQKPSRLPLLLGIAAFVSIVAGLVAAAISQSKVKMALNNIRSYYGDVDGGLFLNEQEKIIRRANMNSNIFFIAIIVILLIMVYLIYRNLFSSVKDDRNKRASNDTESVDGKKSYSGNAYTFKASMDIKKTVESEAAKFTDKMKEKNIEFTVDTEDVEFDVVFCDEGCIGEMVNELLEDAYSAVKEEGRIYLALKQFFVSDEGIGSYELTVEDDADASRKHSIKRTKELAGFLDGYIDTEEVKGVGSGVTVNMNLKVKRNSSDEGEQI
ncbi:MAG: hypothetical protein K6G12_06595 [Lachnospiraceae bacterium]|nr:hypothetical protein [Lachnospiraceae bacterium]